MRRTGPSPLLFSAPESKSYSKTDHRCGHSWLSWLRRRQLLVPKISVQTVCLEFWGWTGMEWCSRRPWIDDTHSHTLKVGYIPGRNGQTMHERRGCDEGITIRVRVRHVKRRASLGDGGINH